MSFILTDIDRHRLENGLTIITRENHSVPIVTIMTWYRIGSRYEKPGNTGASHFLEHLMFKGTKRLGKGEIDHITTRHGGFNNAFTSLDYTAYYFSFASDRWRAALEIEVDRMCNCNFDEAEFELERSVILEELRMELDHPWEVLRQAVAMEAFKQHPYRFPVIGISEDVAQLSLTAIQEFYRKYYQPSNATLVLAGDFETRQVVEYARELFGSLPDSSLPRCSTTPEQTPSGTIRFEVDFPTTIPRLIIGLPAPSVDDQNLYAFHILDKLLTEGKLSRLYQRLIEKEELVSLVTTEICETVDPFLLLIRADVKRQSSLKAVESAILEELIQLIRDPLTSDELARAKKQCTTHYLNDFETPSDQAFNIGLFETLERPDVLTAYCERIERVTPEEVTLAARSFLDPDKTILGSMRPPSKTRLTS